MNLWFHQTSRKNSTSRLHALRGAERNSFGQGNCELSLRCLAGKCVAEDITFVCGRRKTASSSKNLWHSSATDKNVVATHDGESSTQCRSLECFTTSHGSWTSCAYAMASAHQCESRAWEWQRPGSTFDLPLPNSSAIESLRVDGAICDLLARNLSPKVLETGSDRSLDKCAKSDGVQTLKIDIIVFLQTLFSFRLLSWVLPPADVEDKNEDFARAKRPVKSTA